MKESNRFLFEKLAVLPGHEERALLFNDYMSVKFHLHHWEEQATDSARASIRNSYLKFLKGWKIDSNSLSGAVLKRWVESRMGIAPTFHKARIGDLNSQSYVDYSLDVVKGSSQTSAIQSQLDLLYEFCQFELRRKYPEVSALPLYRGTHDAEEYDILESSGKWNQIVRMNNLVSFTDEQERAWEFGRTVWRTTVPLAKIFFYNDLLPGILKGEDEYIIIGGEYRVQRMV